MNQAGGPGGYQLVEHAKGPGALAKQRDILGIAAKVRNMTLDPGEGQVLILECHVASRLICLQAEEAEGAEAIVDRDDDYVPIVGQVLGAVPELAPRAADVGAAVDPHHDRQQGVSRQRDSEILMQIKY